MFRPGPSVIVNWFGCVVFTMGCPRQTQHLRFETSLRPETILIGRGPHLAKPEEENGFNLAG